MISVNYLTVVAQPSIIPHTSTPGPTPTPTPTLSPLPTSTPSPTPTPVPSPTARSRTGAPTGSGPRCDTHSPADGST